MQKATFHIIVNLKTSNGFESFGKFYIGNNPKSAMSVFSKLKGKENVGEENILHLDLVEINNGLPVNMQMISCSLEELAENCRIITKEVFKIFNLEEKA